jgi:hypothetical protein
MGSLVGRYQCVVPIFRGANCQITWLDIFAKKPVRTSYFKIIAELSKFPCSLVE